MYTFVKYDARLSLWRVFSARYSGDHVWRWNASWSQPLRQANTVWRNPDWLCDVLMSAHVYHCAKNSGGFPNTCWKLDTITRQMLAVLVLFRPLPNVDIQKFGMWGMYNLTKAYGNIENPFANRRVEDWEPAMVTLKIKRDCSTVHDTTLWANIFARSHLECGTDSVFIRFCRSHKYFKDAKVMQINRIFENN